MRAHVLRLVRDEESTEGLKVLRVFDGPEDDLGVQSEEIIRREAGNP